MTRKMMVCEESTPGCKERYPHCPHRVKHPYERNCFLPCFEGKMCKTDEKQCLECGWAGDIVECRKEKAWSEHAGGGFIAVPLCPKCGSEHLFNYDSLEAKDSRLQFLG